MRGIYNSAGLTALVNEVGFLPLLRVGIDGWSADEQVADDCRYTILPDGGWEWPLWQWKGSVIQESGCAYGKFFMGKAGFVSKHWWPHFCNWRRSRSVLPPDSVETMILATLSEQGSLVTRELRAACGFTGTKMRGKFDAYVTRLEMGCHIVTEDFIYPHDKHGREYGWGWALLTTPEALLGRNACMPPCTPAESYERMVEHFHTIMPGVSEAAIKRVLG